MNSKLPIILSIVGLGAAWYWARRQSAQLSSILAGSAQAPGFLPSRQIGDGYIPAIGALPSSQVGLGWFPAITGQAPLFIDPATGDVTADMGTDLLLHAIDPFDPTLPNVQSQNADLIARARADMDVDPSDQSDEAVAARYAAGWSDGWDPRFRASTPPGSVS